MSLYNIDFDMASIMIYVVVIISYFQKKHINNRQHKIFLALLFSSLLVPVCDIPGAVLIEFKCNTFEVMLVNMLYYLARQASNYFFLLYIISNLEINEATSLHRKIIVSSPFAIMIVLILLNPVTNWIFKYENFEYSRGPLRSLCYAVGIFYYFWSVYFIRMNKALINKNLKTLVYIICFFNLFHEVYQYFYSSILIHSLAFSICILLLLLNIERYGMVVDSVTGIAKKEHLENVVTNLIHNKHPFNMILVRMSDYDLLTTNYGIENAEEVMKSTCRYLLTYAEKGKAFQINNETFALLFKKEAGVQGLSEMIYEGLKRPWLINNVEVGCEYYITSISYPENVPDKETLMAYLQHFKKMQQVRYGIVSVSDLQINDKVREQLVEKAIENGLKDGNFEIHYQPICTAKDKHFMTAEALLRLKDPELGNISPEEFIPIAEQTGSIIQIGYFVLDTVCNFIEHHDMEKLGLDYIEVNLSTVQCMQRNFIEIIDEVTRRHNIKSKYLCFEITETASPAIPTIFNENLRQLNERGHLLALDDFGTGYGNLERMISSDFKIIKFDKSMTQQLASEKELKKVYRTLQAMIQTMGSHVVSEGVETKEQYEFVRDAGCHYIQGFYFSKPLPEKEFCEFIQAQNQSVE